MTPLVPSNLRHRPGQRASLTSRHGFMLSRSEDSRLLTASAALVYRGITEVVGGRLMTGGAIVLIALAGLGCSGGREEGERSAPSVVTTTSTTLAAGTTLGQPDADSLAAGIVATDGARRAEVLASELAAAPGLIDGPLVPEGSVVVVDPGSFRLQTPGVATVEATVSGPAPGRWRLLLVYEADRWKLLGTERMP